ncbi:MAG: ABC transporter substrate-binding protein [Lachnospiraceae bacterium]|nr:ABC transporter substrate-binding protein [Lachnospiraceae bacterium]
MRKLFVFILCMLFMACPAGCSKAKEAQENAGNVISADDGTVRFTDSLGREVTVKESKKTAVLLGSFCDIWVTAGGEVAATVKDAWTSFDLGLSEDTVNLGSFLNPDVERLIALAPDLVIASSGTEAQIGLREVLEAAGINVCYFEVNGFEDYLFMLDVCTAITGDREAYEKYGLKVREELEKEKKRADGSAPTVLFIRAAAGSVKAKGSTGTVGGEILKDLGCVNIADSDGTILDDLSLEAIVKADPDYIFVTTQGEDTEAALSKVREMFSENPAWNSLSAVKNGNYHEIEKELYNSKPNARWAEAYRKLADILYGK